jgi:hypothetical protein
MDSPTTASDVLLAHIKQERKARNDTTAKNIADSGGQDRAVLQGIKDILGGKHNSVADPPLHCFLPPQLIRDGGFLQRRVSTVLYRSKLYE